MVSSGDVAALVTVHRVQGSVPRETDARMTVRADGSLSGTIGGGALEWDALHEARRLIAAGRGPAATIERILGPDLGQCCGGRVSLLIETFDRRDLEAPHPRPGVADPHRHRVEGARRVALRKAEDLDAAPPGVERVGVVALDAGPLARRTGPLEEGAAREGVGGVGARDEQKRRGDND